MTSTFLDLQDDDEDALPAEAKPDAEFDDANADLAAGEGEEGEWSLAQHHRTLLRVLLNAITDHVNSGDFEPSIHLEDAMAAVKHELWNY